jgi:lactoylglutathione lyase
MPQKSPVRELRLALTVENFDELVRFYRDVLGLPEIQSWDEPTGRGMILDAGRATLELLSPDQTDLVEVGETGVSGPVRLALEVEDSVETAQRLTDAGAEHVGGPVVTPWQHRNVRLRAPGGMQITLFTVLKEAEES